MTLALVDVDPEPLALVQSLDVGRHGPVPRGIPVLRGRCDALPGGLRALVLAADLQARALPAWGAPGGDGVRLAGEAVAEQLAGLAEAGELPPADVTGVVLAGDLWCDPACKKMGGLGDVRPVWRAFAERFRWVAGVAGNHDAFGHPRERAVFVTEERTHLLDGDVVELDGLRIGGVGGIVGDPRRPNRRDPVDQTDLVLSVLARGVDLLVLHEGPDVPGSDLPGEPALREALEVAEDRASVVCGHVHWRRPGARHGRRQLLNVDARVLVLLPAR